MKANELRIGIYVLVNNTVKQVLAEDIPKFKPTGNDLQPIPLTNQWLAKFGFSNKIAKAYIDGLQCFSLAYSISDFTYFHVLIQDNQFFLGEERDMGVEPSYGTIEFVHQLQNFFYDLTGEELTVK